MFKKLFFVCNKGSKLILIFFQKISDPLLIININDQLLKKIIFEQ